MCVYVQLQTELYISEIYFACMHRICSFASRTTLGMVIDDPRNDKDFATKIAFHFEQAQVANFIQEYQSRTTFIASMNLPCLRWLASDLMWVFYAVYALQLH